jgi:hypothetical protein
MARMMKAGPATNADARNRGASSAVFQKRRDGVNRDRPHDRDEHERDVPLLVRRLAEEARVEQVAADVQVQQQVTIQDDHVPREH